MIETTKIVLDLAVIFLIVFGLFRGIRKGFVQTLYQALRWILCLILAQILYPYVADFLRQIGLLEMIQGGSGRESFGDDERQRQYFYDSVLATARVPERRACSE